MAEPTSSSGTAIELRSTLTCPGCGRAEELEMPSESCLFFHECSGCGALLRPLPGDCCVFCSYGSVTCPPKQAEGGARCGASTDRPSA